MASPQGICKLCGRPAELRRSHILPEHLYERFYSSDKHPVLNQVHFDTADPTSNRVRYLQKGLRERLLCNQCEQHLNESGEKYCSEALIKNPSRVGLEGVVQYLDLDYKSVKLYFFGIFWRIGVASIKPFDEVTLSGRHERELREAILNCNAGAPGFFPCIVDEDNSPHLRKLLLQPRTVAITGGDGIQYRVIELVANGQRWHFVLSSNFRPSRNEVWQQCSVRDEGTLLAMKFDFRETEFGLQHYNSVMGWGEFDKRVRGAPKT
jgi:hypothetical protein